MFGPSQVADLGAGVHTLQRLWGQGVPKPDAAVSSTAPGGQQAMLVWGPGNGFHCSQVIHVRLQWTQRGVVPDQQLRWQKKRDTLRNTTSKSTKIRTYFIRVTTVPCCRCHQKRAADGQCSTLSRTLPVCVPAIVSLTAEEASAHLSEESYDHGYPKTAGRHSMLTLLQTDLDSFELSRSQYSSKILKDTIIMNVKYSCIFSSSFIRRVQQTCSYQL